MMGIDGFSLSGQLASKEAEKELTHVATYLQT